MCCLIVIPTFIIDSSIIQTIAEKDIVLNIMIYICVVDVPSYLQSKYFHTEKYTDCR